MNSAEFQGLLARQAGWRGGFTRTSAAKVRPRRGRQLTSGSHGDRRSGDDDEDEDDRPEPSAKNSKLRKVADRREDEADRSAPGFSNPKPWETVVRIRVIGNRSTGFGSGTVISSTEKESLILTCAHIFKIEGRKPTAPKQFPRRIMI